MTNNGRDPFIRKVERPEKASQSLLARIDVCPYSGALYIDHKGGPQTHAMARGEAFHSFAEQATKMLMDEGEPSMPPEVAKDLMQAILDERTDLALPAHEHEACRIMAWQWGSATFLELDRIVSVEQMHELQIGDWLVRGKVDRAEIVDGEAYVYDYKTSLAMPDQERMENDFQTQMYGLMLADGSPEGESVPLGKGVSGFHLRQLFPRYTSADGRLVDRYAYKDRANLHDFKRTVESHLAKLDHGLATGEWAASPGSHCQTCPASSECPIPPHLREVKTIGTPEDAQEVCERIIFLGDELAGLNKTVKGWASDNGPIQVGDFTFDFTYSESEVLKDKDGLKQHLEQTGHDPALFFSKRKSTRFGKKKVTA